MRTATIIDGAARRPVVVDLGLAGRTALVAGSTSGLGHAIAQALGREGAAVVLCGRRGCSPRSCRQRSVST